MGAFDFSFPVLERPAYRHIGVDFDGAMNTLWIAMKKADPNRPLNMSLPLLQELRDLMDAVQAGSGHWHHQGKIAPIHYVVTRSSDPIYYNQGGDLAYFRQCIQDGDGEALRSYSRLCASLLHEAWVLGHASVTSIALVQGRALGGGFENALSADFLIAEEHSTFSFPEISFGLFPFGGAMSLLARRIGPYRAERMMTDSRFYSARELLEMGLVDEVCPSGSGEATVRNFVARHSRQRAARHMVQRSRQRLAPSDLEEMNRIVDEWVELSMTLTPRQLRVMDLLIMMQGSRRSGTADRCEKLAHCGDAGRRNGSSFNLQRVALAL
ncbi:MAG: enoyl-CoA hydratase [Herminiimonas sp.]|nr:enoyl-CoA hydratase [Herminiimonas sp.]MDB5853448.1 enoyl-CoA hydratase [Herminiimonas sp.]